MNTKHCLLFTLALATLTLSNRAGLAASLSTAFTYQGRLTDGGNLANGHYDLRFSLHTAETSGSQVGNSLTNANTAVANGLFTTTIDFGAGVFDGTAYWLEIGVRTNGSVAAFTTLSPRQVLTATPYALYASSAGVAAIATNLTGVLPDAQLSSNIPRLNGNPAFSGAVSFSPALGPPFAVGNSTKVIGLNADLLDGLDSSAFAASAHTHSAADLVSGTLLDGRLGGDYSGALTFNNAANNFTGTGSGLTSLNASSLASGTVPDTRLSANVALLNGNQTFAGANTFNGVNTFTNW